MSKGLVFRGFKFGFHSPSYRGGSVETKLGKGPFGKFGFQVWFPWKPFVFQGFWGWFPNLVSMETKLQKTGFQSGFQGGLETKSWKPFYSSHFNIFGAGKGIHPLPPVPQFWGQWRGLGPRVSGLPSQVLAMVLAGWFECISFDNWRFCLGK